MKKSNPQKTVKCIKLPNGVHALVLDKKTSADLARADRLAFEKLAEHNKRRWGLE